MKHEETPETQVDAAVSGSTPPIIDINETPAPAAAEATKPPKVKKPAAPKVKKAAAPKKKAAAPKPAKKTAAPKAKKVAAPKPAKVSKKAGVKAQGQVHKEAFRLLKAMAKEKGVKAAEIVRLAVHKFVGFKE